MDFNPLNFDEDILTCIQESLHTTLRSGYWSLGPQNERLERTFSQIYLTDAITTSSGGSALHILHQLHPSIRTIAVQSNTYFASILPWINSHANILVLGSSGRLLMPDLTHIQTAIESGADAIILTHIGGYPNPYIKDIAELCIKSNVLLFEDCAHAPLVSYNEQFVGTYGDAAILSFFPTKPLPAGEGGLLLIKDAELGNEARRLRNYGKYLYNNKIYHRLPALSNMRMNEFTASILNALLIHYEKIQSRKYYLSQLYDRYLGPLSFASVNYQINQLYKPSFYKYICFAAESSHVTSPVYDLENQITSILERNSYPFKFIGQSPSYVPHICLPISPSMSEDDVIRITSQITFP